MAESLVDAGFTVLHAGSADEALELVERSPIPVSVLVTDIHLPGDRTGLDVAHAMRSRTPALPVIVATGRPDVLGPDWRRAQGVALLRKPYGPGELVATVRKILEDG